MDKFMQPQIIIPIAGVVMIVLMSFGFFISEIIKHYSNNQLKREMIERGMSADEIERILAAGPKPESSEE